jgi:hypothetical protein
MKFARAFFAFLLNFTVTASVVRCRHSKPIEQICSRLPMDSNWQLSEVSLISDNYACGL